MPGQAGGVSTFDRPTAGEPHWWCLPAGTELPPELVARRDHTLRDGRTHYSLAPACNMPLDAYRAALAALHDRCRRIS